MTGRWPVRGWPWSPRCPTGSGRSTWPMRWSTSVTCPGHAVPGRKILTLVHAIVAGAEFIDDCDVLRSGSTQRVLGHKVMAPSTLGTFLRGFTFGHVRQLDRLSGEL